MERLQATRRAHPDVGIAANERRIKETLGVLDGELWSAARYVREVVIPRAGAFTTLKRMAAVLAAIIDEGRTRGGRPC